MNKKLTFHIDNMAYSINIDDQLEQELTKFLPSNKTLTTKELLYAYVRMTQQFKSFKNDIEQISNKLPEV